MNIYPMHTIPRSSFIASRNESHRVLKLLRDHSKPYHGFFMVRHDVSNNPGATFVLSGGKYSGRWMLGRVRKHKTQPGRYEIVIKRTTTCYYISVDSDHDLAEELRYLAVDADAEFIEPDSKWISTPDIEFSELGFMMERVHS